MTYINEALTPLPTAFYYIFFRQKTRRPHLKCYFIGHSKISKQTDRDKIYVENFETAKMEWMNYFIANL
jgi:hypothetical protein